MVAGRRGKQFTVELDLGQFGDVGVDDADDGRDDEQAAEAFTWTPARKRRAAIAAGLVVFLSLSAWGATTEIGAHRRLANLLSAPGAVLSLADPFSEAWSAETDVRVPVFMPGLVVVQRGAELRGVDIGTGEERWQVEVGTSAACGPAPNGMQSAGLVDPLVCIATETDGQQTVTVVRTTGESVSRVLDEGGATVAATTDGDVLTVRRTGPTPPPPDVHLTVDAGGGYSVEGSMAAGQDAVVQLEDAATGAPRWERTLTFAPVEDASSCGIVNLDSNGEPTYDATHLTVTTPSSFVVVRGCGIQGVFTASGESIELPPAQASFDVLEPYADGGAVRREYFADGGETDTLLQPNGGRTGFSGQVLSPLTTDGTRPDVVLLATPDQSLLACDRQGVPLWVNTLPVTQVLARTSRVAVVLTGYTVAGIDVKTGKTLWIDPASFLESTSTTRDRTSAATDLGASSGLSATAAFTDGTRVMVAMQSPEATTRRLITLDPATGDVRWRSLTTSSDSAWTQYYAVAGHVISLSITASTPGGPPTLSAVTAWR